MLHERTRIEGDRAYLTLTRGFEAVIDVEDVHTVGQFPWCSDFRRDRRDLVYAVRANPTGGQYRLHRVLMKAPDDLVVDHVNGNTLDNRRANLRLATVGQNNANARRFRSNTTGYKGVTYSKRDRKFIAQISHEGRLRSLGYFNTPEEAFAAYVVKARELRGEFARFA